jgi:ABC-2 type transport system ATP-binding protein
MPLLQAQNIVKQYAGHKALDDVSIDVPKQSIFGLLGPNGAGKTSLIRIINQITGPDSGKIIFNGEKLRQDHISQIGYLPEERGLYKKMKLGEQSLYFAQLKGMPKHEAKAELKKWFKKFELEDWWNRKVEELSKGMAQKVQFITTVLHRPKLLILDEPFSGFDPINTNLVKSEILQLRDEGTTVILSTHNMNSVEEICDHIALLNSSKKIIEGTVQEVRERNTEQTYEIEFRGSMMSFTHNLWVGFELVEKNELAKDHNVVLVKPLQGNDINALLGAVLDAVKIVSVRKLVPSMNDVFIKAVEEQRAADAILAKEMKGGDLG